LPAYRRPALPCFAVNLLRRAKLDYWEEVSIPPWGTGGSSFPLIRDLETIPNLGWSTALLAQKIQVV
jgi:hypothetical protein